VFSLFLLNITPQSNRQVLDEKKSLKKTIFFNINNMGFPDPGRESV